MSSTDFQVDFAKILQVHHTDLRATLNVQELIPLMRKHELLTTEECQGLKCNQTESEKIDQLVHILPRKGKSACAHFIKCLEAEKQHAGHPDLALKLKETCAKLSQQLQIEDSDGIVNQEPTADSATLVKQISNSLLERDNIIANLRKEVATLKKQLQQRDKLISDSRLNNTHVQLHAVTEVSKFQQLLHYINGGHGNQLSANYDTRTMAKYYQDLRVVMKKAKQFLKQDAEYVHHCINTTPEDSDGICSKASSLDPESQLHGVKVSKATELSSEVVKEFKEETTEESVEESVEESYSSADETDDEILDAKMEPEQEHKVVLRLKSKLQRPESWIAYKEKRASKGISHYSVSSTTQARKGSTTDSTSDANDDKLLQEALVTSAVTAYEEVEHENMDVNLACSTVEISSIDDQEECSCTILTGYLHKEGTSPHDRWKKRYFTLTKEYLYYSKSQQDSKPIDGFPLIGLALEKKKKGTFKVVNKQAINIKVDKPGKRQASIANSKVIKLKASSEKEALKWIQSIDDAIAKLRSQYISPAAAHN